MHQCVQTIHYKPCTKLLYTYSLIWCKVSLSIARIVAEESKFQMVPIWRDSFFIGNPRSGERGMTIFPSVKIFVASYDVITQTPTRTTKNFEKRQFFEIFRQDMPV